MSFRPGDLCSMMTAFGLSLHEWPSGGRSCGTIEPGEIALCLSAGAWDGKTGSVYFLVLSPRMEVGYVYASYFANARSL